MAQNKFESLSNFITKEHLIPKGSTIVLGLSGGPDSVFLLQYLSHLKATGQIATLIAAHLDHEWRADSSSDTEFCKKLCDALSIPFETQKLSQLDTTFTWDGSKEEIGRKARRYFLESVAQKYNADRIALGQHAQDQQETFFIRLLRGTSLSGLCGMWPQRGIYIRPLLRTDKKDILTYLDAHAITYLQDPSNQDPSFLRNRVRNQLLPVVHEIDSRFDQNFLSTLDRLQETEQYLQSHTKDLFKALSNKVDGTTTVSLAELFALPTIMQIRILIHWFAHEKVPFTVSHALFEELLRFLASDRGGTHAVHPSWQIKKKSGTASISKKF